MTTADGDVPGDGELPGAVDDEIWTELVASFHASSAARSELWPEAENVGPARSGDDGVPVEGEGPAWPAGAGSGIDGAGGAGGPGAARVVRPAARPEGSEPPASLPTVRPPLPPPAPSPELTYWSGSLGPRDWDPPGEPDEPYAPPVPPPLPEVSTAAKAAWLVGLGGPGYLLTAAILHWQTSQWVALLCVLGGVAGFCFLVSRLKGRDEDGDDPDDPTFGAVV